MELIEQCRLAVNDVIENALSAVGVEAQGNKHVLGMQDGASENTEAVKALLVHFTRPRRRFGAALPVCDRRRQSTASSDQRVFGAHRPVQRCRTHELRNVLQHLPKEQHDQVKAVIRAAYRLDAKTGMAKLRSLADWLRREREQAAHSLLEGSEKTFTVNTLGVPPSLHRCLAITNIIESPQSGVRKRTGNVTRWRDAAMVQRWAAAAFLATATNFRKIMGHQELWTLAAILGRTNKTSQEKVA